MATAKVFKSGNSQAVRLPKEFRFNAKELEIERRGRETILREKPRNMKDVLALIQELPGGMMDKVEALRDAPPQRRKRA